MHRLALHRLEAVTVSTDSACKLAHSRAHELLKRRGNILIVVLHIHPGSINGHGLNLLLRQQLPADGLPLLGHFQVCLGFLEVVPELALVVGQRLEKRTGSAVQGMRLILDAPRWCNCSHTGDGQLCCLPVSH